ncbi:flagellar biosynthesis protein FliQ [Gilvimarinus agarilyticus]|uniref:flagellar biosynthesis protein FliQ n=1 Tax=unclassified Gilvimarinus TaxID=2642066 RepID=UPI001C087D32|nr:MULTISPECIES: flagellar biosynthesis protein FliQ [unclassified Gilvimarinus]MBU2887224.1 flagellar biosynthesis protein FliQ [Gilvimarinus agarilyticus]MDO6571883.1 flagellar biosynthesis protein FliQ [Gilvimarinus sp. 2_MG-2023]MDO6745952.1 flagellar biosynthesis protein FliQ [Gilvimarinus sp. 1_MG-2023]
MTPEIALSLFADGLYLTVIMVLLIVGPSLVVGLVVSMFQAATQINEQTLSFLPRLIIMLLTIMLAGNWMVSKLSDLFNRLFNSIPGLIG